MSDEKSHIVGRHQDGVHVAVFVLSSNVDYYEINYQLI